MKSALEKEFQYYIDHQADFVKEYRGKYLVIKDRLLVGVYDTEVGAYIESAKKYELGTFLIQECQPGNENYTQTFRHRTIFAK